jgi:hypothetical protein
MVLVIFLTNVLIRKREMMKLTQKVDKDIKVKELQRKFSRKKICTKEDISSSDEDGVSDSETWRVLFMAVEDSNKEPLKMTWTRKQDLYSNEECSVALQAKQKKRGWYVDS